MKLIFGLGNPGRKYQHTRHNIGRDAVERLASHLGADDFTRKAAFDASITEANGDRKKILLVLPETFMNLSGKAIVKIVNFYHVPLEQIIVVHDDMDFPLGVFSYSRGGGAAGHNGVASVIESLGTDAFARLRLGIDRPAPPIKPEDYVLQKFSIEQTSVVDNVLKTAEKSLLDWISLGLDKTMNTWNGV